MTGEHPARQDAPGPTAGELVGELGRRFRAGDLDAAFALYHPDLVIEQPASLPHGGQHHGRDGVTAMGRRFAEHWDRSISEPRRWECGDTAFQVTTQTWTARATGRRATVDVLEQFTVRDGLISGIRVFPQDTHLLLATLEEGPP